MEQQRLKKERQLDFDMQKALEIEYKKAQTVHDGGEAPASPKGIAEQAPRPGEVGGGSLSK